MSSEEPLMNPSTKTLVGSLIKNPANSIGLNGARGSGKLHIAKYLCRQALNIKPGEFGIKVDVIDCAEQGGIDDIRDIKKKLAIKSIGEEDVFQRAVIFANFHKISQPAQNSILKLLEEPPADTILVLLVDTKSSVLPTIVSRLQWIDILPLSLKTLEEKFKQYDKNRIRQAYLLSDGYLENFEKVLKDESESIKLAVEDVKKILRLKKYERITRLDSILNNQDYSPEEFLTALQKIYSTLMRREVENNARPGKQVLAGLEQINKTKESLKYNPNQKLILTNLFYKI